MISTHSVASSKHWLFGLLLLLVLNLISASAQAAKPKLAVSKAAWSAKLNTLTIKGSLKNAAGHEPIEILDTNGRRLGLATGDSFNLTLKGQDLPSIPCTVRAQSGSLETLVKVGGAPKSCASPAPSCQIVSPVNGAALQAHQSVSFQAKTQQKDKKAGPLKVEWDFAGGVMQTTAQRMSTQAAGNHHTEATFVRDNAHYRVRFIATDSLNRRCEDSIAIAIGNPPAAAELPDMAPLAQAAQQSQPKLGSGLQGQYVVMPFEKRSMQTGHEAEIMVPYTTGTTPPTAYTPQYNSINAYVYQKGLQPVLQDDSKVQLTYSAASNIADPAGANVINSTSQNWPVGSTFAAASLKKGELWEVNQRPQGAPLANGYYTLSLMAAMSNYSEVNPAQHVPEEDEGAYDLGNLINVDHGRYMPGKSDPYAANEPQDFSSFDDDNHWFSALWLPLTNINDSGRVSPTSLFRVQAVDKDSQQPLATTDVTLAAGKDFHCRECHALGKIGANADVHRINNKGQSETDLGLIAAASDSIEDLEAAALQNMANLHMFNDSTNHHHQHNPVIYGDMPSKGCIGEQMCHLSATISGPEISNLGSQHSHVSTAGGSESMHRMHGALQYNADRSGIMRNANGEYACREPDKTKCNLDPAKSLFPVKDANGNILPMEDNCLKCHGGQREPCYRDRMYTAGVTCYQCHGDMLAVAQQYPKLRRHADDNPYRTPWLEQPDCAACHVGSANVGQDAKNGFFSAGIKTLAFAADDPAATPNAVDLSNPDQRRFTVLPTELQHVGYGSGEYNQSTLETPLFRLGKDSHGAVGCPACHGPAHGIWPNRDPNANDNVTALELQGHTGSVLDCNVCHLPDSFAKHDDLDEGIRVADAKVGVLGGPHNLHPINDPNWWLNAKSDAPNSDGSTSGGWHNDYAKKPGHDNEDQCAACHGNDHKGTRLSKTPVDRVFDFSKQPDWKLLKKAGIKAKVTVKAGTAIGCDTCHSITMSCSHSPVLSLCGQTSDHVTGSTNQPPTFTPVTVEAVIGDYSSFQLALSDSEGDTSTIALARPDIDGSSLGVDSSGQLSIFSTNFWTSEASVPDPKNPTIYQRPPLRHVIPLLLRDDRGAEALRDLTVNLSCPVGLVFDVNYNSCMPVTIYSIPPTGGLNVGGEWTFAVKAEAGNGQPLQYSLLDPVPPGMSIDQQGVIHWQTNQVLVNSDHTASVQVQDSDGNQASQPFSFTLTMCVEPMRWDASTAGCVGSAHITSTPPTSTNANMLSYQVTYTEEKNRSATFNLIDAPVGFQIDQKGLITGTPYLSTLGERVYLSPFKVQVAVAPDNWAQQQINVEVCGATMRFDAQDNGCVLYGPVQQTLAPDYGVSAGQVYHYASTWTNSNGLPLSYSLLGAQPGMNIDGATGVFSWDTTAYAGQYGVIFGILAKDGTADGWGAQKFTLNVCPGETPIYEPNQGCIAGPIQFNSTPNIGADYNQVYSYQADTSNANNLPVSYTLSNVPAGVNPSINASGLLTLDTTGLTQSPLMFNIIATDTQGAWTQQQMVLNLCLQQDTPTWDPNQYMCVP